MGREHSALAVDPSGQLCIDCGETVDLGIPCLTYENKHERLFGVSIFLWHCFANYLSTVIIFFCYKPAGFYTGSL